jgi:hypothetical protein
VSRKYYSNDSYTALVRLHNSQFKKYYIYESIKCQKAYIDFLFIQTVKQTHNTPVEAQGGKEI